MKVYIIMTDISAGPGDCDPVEAVCETKEKAEKYIKENTKLYPLYSEEWEVL